MRSVYRSEKQMHNEHKLITQDEKALSQVLLEISKFQGNLMQCFRATVNGVRTQNTFSERNQSNEPGNRFESSVQSVFTIADQAIDGKSLPDGNKDHLLNQARSELLKQEHQVGSLNNCIDELQEQTCAQRLELEDAQHGQKESQRKQFRLQEELSMKEKKRFEKLRSEIYTRWEK